MNLLRLLKLSEGGPVEVGGWMRKRLRGEEVPVVNLRPRWFLLEEGVRGLFVYLSISLDAYLGAKERRETRRLAGRENGAAATRS